MSAEPSIIRWDGVTLLYCPRCRRHLSVTQRPWNKFAAGDACPACALGLPERDAECKNYREGLRWYAEAEPWEVDADRGSRAYDLLNGRNLRLPHAREGASE